jgi:hypothetical protein
VLDDTGERGEVEAAAIPRDGDRERHKTLLGAQPLGLDADEAIEEVGDPGSSQTPSKS